MKKTLVFCFILMLQKVSAQLPNFQINGYKMLDSMNGASLYSKSVRSKKADYEVILQVIDLRYVKMGQWVSLATDLNAAPEGKYLAVEKYNKSPYFKMHQPNNTVAKLLNKYQTKLFSVMNAAFFEQYADSTQLAFPLKVQGKIHTAGSSPYGPQKLPKHPHYKKVVLEALVWTDSTVVMQHYNTQTGYPLTSESVQNALVSYNYQDHPAVIIRESMPNRYHVLGTLSENNMPSHHLFILTVNKTTLENAASELKQLGIKSTIMTVDGGSSVFIFNPKNGTLESPLATAFPHYLYFIGK